MLAMPYMCLGNGAEPETTMTKPTLAYRPLRYLRQVQASLTALHHDHKLDQHEYELVLGGMWSAVEPSDIASQIVADRNFVEDMSASG
jgi:hypothetical protein